MSERRSFPILGGGIIPWAAIEPCARRAWMNHGESLDRLAERGGLTWCETLAVLENQPWREMPAEEARRRVREMCRMTRPEREA